MQEKKFYILSFWLYGALFALNFLWFKGTYLFLKFHYIAIFPKTLVIFTFSFLKFLE